MRIPLFTLILMSSLLFFSCIKDDNTDLEPIVEPPWPVEVKTDSIMTGNLYNVSIGMSAEEVYKGLQGFSNAKGKIEYLSISGVLNVGINSLKDRIPLYSGLILDQKPSSVSSGRINFKNNKIESIYSRDGVRLIKWPYDAVDPLRLGDPLESIYDKLKKLESDSRYKRLFEYIGMFEKNMDRPFDTIQKKSTLWQSRIAEDDKNFVSIDFIFENEKLVKIRSRHERYL